MSQLCVFHMSGESPLRNAARWEADLLRIAANDPELTEVNWWNTGAGNDDADLLAAVLDGNTFAQTVNLNYNRGLTDAGRLLTAVGRSGVVSLKVAYTGVGTLQWKAALGVMAANAQRRLRANDPDLKMVDWCDVRAGNEDIVPLVHGLHGNYVLQTLDLCNNFGLDEIGELIAAVSRSGVVGVKLCDTGVNDTQKEEMTRAVVANARRRLLANDEHLKVLDWNGVGVDNADVAQLAEWIDGNTRLQAVLLRGNSNLKQLGPLVDAVGRSAVVGVELEFTGVEEAQLRAMSMACDANKEHIKLLKRLCRSLQLLAFARGTGDNIEALHSGIGHDILTVIAAAVATFGLPSLELANSIVMY